MPPLGLAESRPELVIGLVAPVGAPLKFFTNVLIEALASPPRSYRAEVLHLSSLTRGIKLDAELPPETADEYTRIRLLMKAGDEIREKAGRGDVLALMAAGKLNAKRVDSGSFAGHATVLRQIKHPDEVYALREIYGDAFHLVALYTPREVRKEILRVHGSMTAEQADELIETDESEPQVFGQKLRDSFYLADVFMDVTSTSGTEEQIRSQIERFLVLLFGSKIRTPSVDEYGMFLAHAAAQRSAQLSRQVGAAILTRRGDVISIGTNEVPCYGGGQYWEGDPVDERDHVRGRDSSDQMKEEILSEALDALDPAWSSMPPQDRPTYLTSRWGALQNARVMNLTEFGRAVHAEVEALLSAGRMGISVQGATLYTTTFPCHNCAKHIVDAGIQRVVYIEPYPKSLARYLHQDAIAIDQPAPVSDKVQFEAFVGVAPRRYAGLFAATTPEGRRIRRKDAHGNVDIQTEGLRISVSRYNYIEREALATRIALSVVPKESQ